MAKLPQVTGERLVRALQRAGWDVVRVRGSHHVMRKGAEPERRPLVIPVHSRPLKRATLADILKQAELTIDELRELYLSARYVVVLKRTREPDEVGYTVNVPSLPGCITEGDTVEEALENAREAIALYLEEVERSGERLPHPEEIVTSVEIDPRPERLPAT
jgi:predicted RNase H-like HicB family nuclease/predicted RNA binding protein YcfA (HicA-like mRNA interferase family)